VFGAESVNKLINAYYGVSAKVLLKPTQIYRKSERIKRQSSKHLDKCLEPF